MLTCPSSPLPSHVLSSPVSIHTAPASHSMPSLDSLRPGVQAVFKSVILVGHPWGEGRHPQRIPCLTTVTTVRNIIWAPRAVSVKVAPTLHNEILPPPPPLSPLRRVPLKPPYSFQSKPPPKRRAAHCDGEGAVKEEESHHPRVGMVLGTEG